MSTINNPNITRGGDRQRTEEYGNGAVLPDSKSMSFNVMEFNGGQSILDSNGFNTQQNDYDTVPGYGFYPQYQPFPSSEGQGYASNHGAIDGGGLHPTTSLSPSAAHDHFSPPGYASDTAVLGDPYSEYSTPSFDHGFGDTQPPMPNIQDTTRGVSDQFGSEGQAIAQPMALNHQVTGPPIISLSPQLTIASVPQTQQFLSGHQPVLISHDLQNTFTQPLLDHSTYASNVNETASSGISSQTLNLQRPKLVVTVDEYSGDEVSSQRSNAQDKHRRNSSKRSNGHLSPYPEDDSSSEEDTAVRHNVPKAQISATEAWARVNNGGSSGIPPEGRSALNVEDLPTLGDMEERRKREEKNAEVEDWLTHSEVGSDGENDQKLKGRRKQRKNRPRAKSTNDVYLHGTIPEGLGVSHYQLSNVAIPGPGLILNEPSEMGDDEISDEESVPESPPASITPLLDSESYIPQNNTGTFLPTQKPISERGKTAADLDKSIAGITANLAIMRFRQHAKDTDNASVTATLGTRRNSESDIGSLLGAAGISKLLLSPPQQSERNPVRRKTSFLGKIHEALPSRNNSNKLKRKNSQPAEQGDNAGTSSAKSPKDTQGGFAAPKRIGSFGRSKSPRVDSDISSAGNDARLPKNVASTASGAFKQMWRSRSRSDLGKTPKLGLAELWTQQGGPPMPTLASPAQSRVVPALGPVTIADEDSDNEDGVGGSDGLTMDLSVRTDQHIIPTYDGFKFHARQLNPRLPDFLLERITQEQVKRYKRLVDFRVKHSQSVATRSCSSKARCFALGGNYISLPARPGNKDPDSALVGFHIIRPGMAEDDLGATGDGQTIPAQFPSGVPLPPANGLPVEFECSLCFKVKKFYKPSDWTKHVHEDLQPFTCTFQGCSEPKSFKRKADWVRHENERHRQLESWTCSFSDCAHTCYRKDNFVQHLVREHKVPEPKVRTGRQGGSRSPLTPFDPSYQTWQNQFGLSPGLDDGIDDVWALVDKCHHESAKQPKDEACNFCGNVCTSWKKLTVHLAKHMEQITMPVLSLVDQRRTTVEYPPSNVHLPQVALPFATATTKPLNELPKFLYEEPQDMELESSNMMPAASMMHSYPPTAMQMQGFPTTATPTNLNGQSYPQPQPRSRASSFNSQQDYNTIRQGTTYPPLGPTSSALNTASPFDNGQSLFLQQGNMFIQEPGQIMVNAPYLTPSSNTPASMGYHSSPEGSTHDLGQYGGGFR